VITATQKNDDAEDSEEEEEEADDVLDKESKLIRAEAERSKQASNEKQPTGRVVGVIKRNWRTYVIRATHSCSYSTPPSQIRMSYR
jgi:exosome complex exonuclease DIS3/RRP44